jgi:hypothetical protein
MSSFGYEFNPGRGWVKREFPAEQVVPEHVPPKEEPPAEPELKINVEHARYEVFRILVPSIMGTPVLLVLDLPSATELHQKLHQALSDACL